MKTLLFVPGYQEDVHSRDYESVLALFRNAGYDVRFVDINWTRTTIDDWVNQLLAVYDQTDGDVAIAGFSFGAITALVTASKRSVSQLWLFSLSPFFAEDLKNLKPWEIKRLGKKRVSVAETVSFAAVASIVHCPVTLFVGSREIVQWPEMNVRFNEAKHILPTVIPVVIEGVGHHVEHALYLSAIAQMLDC